jgi:mannitol/fructose-specific phosphotransferase system IIA component (Ntr-type)
MALLCRIHATPWLGWWNQPVVVFGRHPQGIAYGAPDAIPARLFFLVVAPTVTQHLAVLARLIRLLHDPKLRQAFLTATEPANIIALMGKAESKL